MRELHGLDEKPKAFDQVSITMGNPDVLRSMSHGEVKNPETINYRTFKPEKGGLFCERIFGPQRDWECSCGKYKRIKHKGVVCDRCGVEVTQARVRRERMGHIELAVPVTHIWMYKCMPSRIGMMLDLTARHLERVIYYEDYIVIDPMSTSLEKGQLLTENEYREAQDIYGEDAFEAGIGAEALQKMLSNVANNMDQLIVELEEQMGQTRSKQNKRKLSKRLRLVQGFKNSKSRPEWMIMTVLPVIPPDLRPLVPLEGGRFATSDLNDLYRRVINRNNRLKNLLQLKTPDVIIRNEKRMLQEAVDALFDNGRHGRAVTGAGNRPLKSLSDMLKGKGGRFRQNLLGKRVDYSGRSVIVIGPELKLHQCGLPKKMALALFEPFIIRRLKELGYVHTVRSAKRMIERKAPEVWDILEEVTKGHPVLLNRAPTLHRLSIQAFEPVLIEGEAIRVHPLVCTAYNADFDGDQMAVHVPLSVEAQLEARLLMLAPNNIFSPASGKPITTPSQDIILGSFYLTYGPPALAAAEAGKSEVSSLPLFENLQEVEYALTTKRIKLHDIIRLYNPDLGRDCLYGKSTGTTLITTAGRVRFNEIWPDELGYINFNVGKKQLSEIILRCFQVSGKQRTVKALDALKELGFREATASGTSIGVVDMKKPEVMSKLIDKARKEDERTQKYFEQGVITDNEATQRIQTIWSQCTDEIQAAVYSELKKHDNGPNPLFLMVESGARGTRVQMRQLSGIRGLMAKAGGKVDNRPILSNFRSGLSVREFFISSHGARKGLTDTALKTADSGYMTRKLVDVAQDVIVTMPDCGTLQGIELRKQEENNEVLVPLSVRAYGRVSCEEVRHPASNKVLIKVNDLISDKQAKQLDEIGRDKITVRSVLTCEAEHGTCAKCYGLNLATGADVRLGESVGILAAQAIGEPGTQLTMRTFHLGGIASRGVTRVTAKSDGHFNLYHENNPFEVVRDSSEQSAIYTYNNNRLWLKKKITIELSYNDGKTEFKDVPRGSYIKLDRDDKSFHANEVIAEWNDEVEEFVSETNCKATLEDFYVGVNVQRDNEGWKVIKNESDRFYTRDLVNAEGDDKFRRIKMPFIQANRDLNCTQGTRLWHNVTYDSKEDAKIDPATSLKTISVDGYEVITERISGVSEVVEDRSKYYIYAGQRYSNFRDIANEISALKGHDIRLGRFEHSFTPKFNANKTQTVTRGETKTTDGTIEYNHVIQRKFQKLVYSKNANKKHEIEVRTLDVLAKKDLPKKVSMDITGGLPRIAELFEARKPKEPCVIARIDGEVTVSDRLIRGKRVVLVTNQDTGEEEKHLIPLSKHMFVHDGDTVQRGEHLTDGVASVDEILEVMGTKCLQEHLVDSVQQVYRAQGVEINDKHVEILVRQMMRKVKITDGGDTEFLWGDQVEKSTFERVNRLTQERGGQPAQAEPVLLGITKASLETESFISAASFQDTTRVLTDAATLGKVDVLAGFKENVIMGHLIPAGTGFGNIRTLVVEPAEGAEPAPVQDSYEFSNDDDVFIDA